MRGEMISEKFRSISRVFISSLVALEILPAPWNLIQTENLKTLAMDKIEELRNSILTLETL